MSDCVIVAVPLVLIKNHHFSLKKKEEDHVFLSLSLPLFFFFGLFSFSMAALWHIEGSQLRV